MTERSFSTNEELRDWCDNFTDRLLRIELEQLYRLYELFMELEDA